MDIVSIIIIIILIAGFAVMFYFLFKLTKPEEKKDDQSIIMLQNQINELNKVLGDGLANTNKTLQDQLGQNTKFVQDISQQSSQAIKQLTQELTQVKSTTQQVLNFSEQLQSLENILKNPKQRGILGEYFLETLLKNVMPPDAYQMQYKFKDGEIVDAIIKVKDKVIPVDSKFSLENYNKIVEEKDTVTRERLEKQFKTDLKTRIDETSKYIRPNEGTMDFAFMFIPSEGIYYDLLVNQVGAVKVNTRDLIEYAFKDKHVIIVSPTSFFAYLQTVLQGLRALQIEKSAQMIRENVEKLQKHLMAYDDYMQKLGNNLGTTVNMYNSSYKEFKKIDKDVTKITEKKSDIDMLEIDKPQI